MFPIYIKEFNSNLTDVVKFTGVAILVLGFSNFIWSVSGSTFLLVKRTDMAREGSLLAQPTEDDRSTSSRNSSASALPSGARGQQHIAASWEPAC